MKIWHWSAWRITRKSNWKRSRLCNPCLSLYHFWTGTLIFHHPDYNPHIYYAPLYTSGSGFLSFFFKEENLSIYRACSYKVLMQLWFQSWFLIPIHTFTVFLVRGNQASNRGNKTCLRKRTRKLLASWRITCKDNKSTACTELHIQKQTCLSVGKDQN